jgi:hypothetical protein
VFSTDFKILDTKTGYLNERMSLAMVKIVGDLRLLGSSAKISQISFNTALFTPPTTAQYHAAITWALFTPGTTTTINPCDSCEKTP